MNNPVWMMSSAFPEHSVIDVLNQAEKNGFQGVEVNISPTLTKLRQNKKPQLNPYDFSSEDAQQLLAECNKRKLSISVSSYENILSDDENHAIEVMDYLLALIRMAHLLGGNENDVCVGTFAGYDKSLGYQENGFMKNLDKYEKIFKPIIKYASGLDVTILYENCPMVSWSSRKEPQTFNNLAGVLAGRKAMYALIASDAHGETYDPSHDVWQGIDPIDVLKAADLNKIKRIHLKSTKIICNPLSVHWGRAFPAQHINPSLAEKANIPLAPTREKRHHFETILPGFGEADSINWPKFISYLLNNQYMKPFVIENESINSMRTGVDAAIEQGLQASKMFFAPLLYQLDEKNGYQFNYPPEIQLKVVKRKEIGITKYKQLI